MLKMLKILALAGILILTGLIGSPTPASANPGGYGRPYHPGGYHRPYGPPPYRPYRYYPPRPYRAYYPPYYRIRPYPVPYYFYPPPPPPPVYYPGW